MKLKEMQKLLKKKKLDMALFFADDPNIYYFTQMQYLNFSALCIPSEGYPILAVPKMDMARARSESRIKKPVCFEKKKKITSFLSEQLEKRKVRHERIGINKAHMTVMHLSRIKKGLKGRYYDISEECKQIRGMKHQEEIRHIRKACRIADSAMQMVINNFRFSTETDVEAALDFYAKQQGADLAFKTIVASGKNSSFPHHTTKHKKLQKGFCIIDYGVRYKGYCSDMTRTLYLGRPTRKEREQYHKVLNVQEKAILTAEPGKTCGEIDRAARNSLGERFTHGLGHGVGVEIHEYPSFGPESRDRLEKDMVFTIEPGIYMNGRFGIRIEDTVLLRDRAVPLTKTTKELVTIRI
ncbi:M24 family metallopeptidase [Candidatus Woesearchaeota archaeon]|nr:M24 family metallopeptidase [Candidatus Woesearchaeota archaeon]